MVYTKNGEAATWLTKFRLDNSSILFTTSQDDVLHAAARGYVVAFETNAIDNRQRLRWTITVVGHLSLASSNEVPAVTSQLSQSSLPPAQSIRLVIAATQGSTEALWQPAKIARGCRPSKPHPFTGPMTSRTTVGLPVREGTHRRPESDAMNTTTPPSDQIS